jgi:hypothetical protein
MKKFIEGLKKLPKFLKAFLLTFLGLAVVSGILFAAFDFQIPKVLIGLILVGVPAYVHFAKK